LRGLCSTLLPLCSDSALRALASPSPASRHRSVLPVLFGYPPFVALRWGISGHIWSGVHFLICKTIESSDHLLAKLATGRLTWKAEGSHIVHNFSSFHSSAPSSQLSIYPNFPLYDVALAFVFILSYLLHGRTRESSFFVSFYLGSISSFFLNRNFSQFCFLW